MPIQWNQQLIKCVLSKVINFLVQNDQKTIVYKTNELNKKYLSWNMQTETCRMFRNITLVMLVLADIASINF